MKKKIWLTSMIFMLILTACNRGTSSPDSSDDPQPPQSETAPAEEMEEGNPSSEAFDLHVIRQQAMKGRTPEHAFNVLTSTIHQVQDAWGKADQVDQAGHGYYAVYEKEGLTFGYNEQGQIFDVRSYHPHLHSYTLDDLVHVLGEAQHVNTTQQDHIYVYQVTPTVQLKFIIPKAGQTVQHLSVFHPALAQAEQEKPIDVVDIRGTSDQLSPQAWQNMLDSRKRFVQLAQQHEKVFVQGPHQKRVALTFDDGPDHQVTPEVISILQRYGVQGSFFFEGRKVEQFPEVVQQAFDQGHLILNHSYHHPDLTQLAPEALKAEIINTEKAIYSITGKRPAMLRPPYGEISQDLLTLADSDGYTLILWSIDTLDWSVQEQEHLIQNVSQNIRNGDIILMHSHAEQGITAQALPAIIEDLLDRGFEIVGLDTLLGIPAYLP